MKLNLNFWNHIIKYTSEVNNRLYPAVSYLELGDFYFQKGKTPKAIKNYILAYNNNNNNNNNNNDSLKFISTYRKAS